MDDPVCPDPDEIALTRPGWISSRLLVRLAWLLVIIAAAFASTGGQQRARPIGLIVEFILVLLGALAWRAWVRRRGAPPPIRLGPEIITLPRNAASHRVALIPYMKVRSTAVLGRGRRARLIIDTASGIFVYPLTAFAAPDAASRIVARLRARVEALPDGPAHWTRIAARNALADDLAGSLAWVTAGTTAVLFLCFLAQTALTGTEPALSTIDAGANAGLLVRDGQWFRLMTANLLHLSANHLVGNCLMLVVLGVMLERLVGHRQFLIVLLATAIVSELASDAYALNLGGALYSIGASGALFGILGALAVVTWRYRRDLPGGYRLSARVWIFLVGLNMLLLPLLQPQVDKAAHAGGLLAGLLIGGLLVWGCRDLRDMRARHGHAWRAALGVLVAVWVAGLGTAALHARDARARAADRYALAHDMLGAARFQPSVQNLVAWSVATDAAAPKNALSDARLLAHHGAAEAARLDSQLADGATRRSNANVLAAVIDTEAALDYRLGYAAIAADLEASISGREADMMGHMMLFLDHTRNAASAGWPTLVLDHGVVRLSVKMAPVAGGEIYALMHRDNALVGMMLVRVPAGFSGAQVLPLPVRRHGPSPIPPHALWLDGRTQVDIARYDATGCHCRDPEMGPFYTAYDPRASALPPP